MDPPGPPSNEILELTGRPQIELQLHSTNQNGEFREAIMEDGVETRRTMEEFHKEMREKVQAILTNLQRGPNIGQQDRTGAEIVPNLSTFHPSQVRASDSSPFKAYVQILHSLSMFP